MQLSCRKFYPYIPGSACRKSGSRFWKSTAGWFFSDQPTRALAAWMHGLDHIIVCPEHDKVSLEMYRICVKWCHLENIYAIQHLARRVIDDREYQILWVERCQQMHRALSNPVSQDPR